MRREVRPERCEQCRAEVWVGDSDDYCAHRATVGRIPISPFGEMLARLLKLETYELRSEGDGFRLYPRNHWQIVGRPAGTLVYFWRVDVLAEHRCGLVLPSTLSVFNQQAGVRPDPAGPPPF